MTEDTVDYGRTLKKATGGEIVIVIVIAIVIVIVHCLKATSGSCRCALIDRADAGIFVLTWY